MNWLVRFLERRLAFPSAKLSSLPVDVVIGIGTGVSLDGKSCSRQSATIADRSLNIYRVGLAKNVLLVGGDHAKNGRLVEAGVMAKRISSYLPERNLFLECFSRNTRQNAENCLAIMKEHGWQTATIVAHPMHAMRVSRSFRKLWIDEGDCLAGLYFRVITAPSEYGGNSRQRMRNFFFFFIWDRLIAMPIFKLRGWI